MDVFAEKRGFLEIAVGGFSFRVRLSVITLYQGKNTARPSIC